jgi:hypothetical protein
MNPSSAIDIQPKNVHANPKYNGGNNDVAVLVLDQPVSLVPLPLNTTPLGASLVGAPVRIVVFGVNNPAGNGFGVKRQLATTIDQIQTQVLQVGNTGGQACDGDSGSPVLMMIHGVETIIGTDSYSQGTVNCTRGDFYMRVDDNLDFVGQYVPGLDGGAPGPASDAASAQDASATGDGSPSSTPGDASPASSTGATSGSGAGSGSGGFSGSGRSSSSGASSSGSETGNAQPEAGVVARGARDDGGPMGGPSAAAMDGAVEPREATAGCMAAGKFRPCAAGSAPGLFFLLAGAFGVRRRLRSGSLRRLLVDSDRPYAGKPS